MSLSNFSLRHHDLNVGWRKNSTCTIYSLITYTNIAFGLKTINFSFGIYLEGLCHGQKCLHLFSDSEAHHEKMGPIPNSNGSLDIAISNAHT